jgi:hypothetical protein
MLGIARRTDERGYPQPLPEPLRTRLTIAWIVFAAVAGACVVLSIALEGSVAWWAAAAACAVSLLSGLIGGLAFADKERDLVIPTPIAAGVSAFGIAVLLPVVLWWLFVIVGMAITHTGK